MNKNDIELLYEYNRWANGQTLHAVSQLTGEQFTRDFSSSYRSVRDTLTHVLSAEWIWLMRWQGMSPKSMLSPIEYPKVELLRAKWAEVERNQANFISQLTDESLEKEILYTNTNGEEWKYPLAQMMQHVVNHSTYHRGQVTTMLRQLGAEALPLDFLVFIDMKSGIT